jgi:predicted Fe-Mo cluster-binding NifX family protein
MSKTKLFIIIFATIIPLGIISFLIVRYTNKPIEQTENKANPETENKKTSISAIKLVNTPMVNATIDNKNSIRYYSLDKGQTFRTPASGGESTIIDETVLNGLTSVEWAPTAPYVLTKIQNRVYSYNYAENKSYAFPIDVTSAQFLSDNRVFYTFQNTDGTVDLSVGKPDGTDWKKIISLSSGAVFLQNIPLKNSISQTLVPSSYRASALRIINVETGQANSVLEEKNGLNISWAPNGEIGIISYTTERGGGQLALSIVDKTGFEVSKIPDIGTIAEKIVWAPDSKTAYFTKPEVANTKILPDDYYTSNLGEFNESLYKIDISTATASQLSSNIGNVDSRDLFLNSAGTELFFINRRDNNLYKVPLR